MSSMLEHFHKSDKMPPQCVCAKKKNDIMKGWGEEEFAYHSESEQLNQEIKVETVKILHFKEGKRLSMHQHHDKSEFFFITDGSFYIEILDLATQTHHSFRLSTGDRMFVPRGLFHRMLCEEMGSILEVSTLDKASDSYRLIKGD